MSSFWCKLLWLLNKQEWNQLKKGIMVWSRMLNILYAFYVCALVLDSLLQKLTGFQLELKILVDFISLPTWKGSLTITKNLSGIKRLWILFSTLVLCSSVSARWWQWVPASCQHQQNVCSVSCALSAGQGWRGWRAAPASVLLCVPWGKEAVSASRSGWLVPPMSNVLV